MPVDGGTLSNWNLAAEQSRALSSSRALIFNHRSSSSSAQEKGGGGGDKSQGRVYEMSSRGCKRMIRDATGCNAVSRGQSRCNQMSFKDVTWLVVHPPARITPAKGGWEKISL